MIIKKEVEYAKEAGDIMALAVAVVKHFKDGKSVAQATELLDELMIAVNGVDQIDDEWAASKSAVLNAVLLGASEMTEALMAKKEVETVPESAPVS